MAHHPSKVAILAGPIVLAAALALVRDAMERHQLVYFDEEITEGETSSG